MMGKKKLSEIRAELRALLAQLPGRSPRHWLDTEIQAAKDKPDRDVETLQMLRSVLERAVRKSEKQKKRRKTAKR
jgi:hypothetical protein